MPKSYNEKALEYWFENEVDYPVEKDGPRFQIPGSIALSPETLGEIKACNGYVHIGGGGTHLVVAPDTYDR